ncbi:coiled-coil domain-containing protein [Paenibacillus sp. KN14-4R]|uniref:coiled-coil domain-containing protein n=1 Tax=Paenibacillus sp. KN14-4R TaxID=3445773 RepID=UPI003F9F0B29
MNRIFPILLTISLFLLCFSPIVHVQAEEETTIKIKQDELQSFLQKGLTIQEIDRELLNLSKQDELLVEKLKDNEVQTEKQKLEVEKTKKKVGKTLRAYYTGDRPSIWMFLFSPTSLPDLLQTLEYMNQIVTNDERSLTAHKESTTKLKSIQAEYSNQRAALKQTRDIYILEKDRILSLQKELDEALTVSGKKEELQNQIDALNLEWKQKGLPVFEQFTAALYRSFQDFTELVNNGDNLKFKGFDATFQITDQQLNDFLRKKNQIFNDLTFQFIDKQLIASGTKEGMQFEMKGIYKLEDNFIRFSITQMKFNGLILPDTTNKMLEDEYDFGISTQKFAAFIKPTSVIIEPGKLVISLKAKI